jgi:membrane-bound ClpP family serine protease
MPQTLDYAHPNKSHRGSICAITSVILISIEWFLLLCGLAGLRVGGLVIYGMALLIASIVFSLFSLARSERKQYLNLLAVAMVILFVITIRSM